LPRDEGDEARTVVPWSGQLLGIAAGELSQVDVGRSVVVDDSLNDHVLVAAVSQSRRRASAAEVKRVAASQSKLSFRSHDRVCLTNVANIDRKISVIYEIYETEFSTSFQDVLKNQVLNKSTYSTASSR